MLGHLAMCHTRLSFLHLLQGSLDNMTCIPVCFPGGTPGLVRRKEVALDETLGGQTVEAQWEGWSASGGAPVTLLPSQSCVPLPRSPQAGTRFSGLWPLTTSRIYLLGEGSTASESGWVGGRKREEASRKGSLPEGLCLLSRTAVIAETYCQFFRTSGEC